MSDFILPSPQSIFDSSPILGADMSGVLNVVPHPDYEITYTEETVFIAGDNPPLKWTIVRKDGTNVAVPTAAAIVVKDANGVVTDTLTPDLESNVAALEQVLAALWSVRPIGTYTVQLTMTIGDDNQIRSNREIVTVW